MIPSGHLRYNNKIFSLQEPTIYGILTPYGYMSWWIELISKDEDNYIMFNSLSFPGVFLPRQLSLVNTGDIGDKYEHTVRVDGADRFLDSTSLLFGIWDSKTQSIQLTGHGSIDEEKEQGLVEVHFEFNANLTFTEINIFETTEEGTQKFVDIHLKDQSDVIFEVKFENVPSGLMAKITGQF